MKKSLKTIAAVVCAALTLCLTGCQKDPEDLIIGTWSEDEITYTLTQGGSTMTLPMTEPGETTEITFKEDKTYTSIYHSVDGDAEGSGTWSITGNTITFTDEFGPVAYNIDKLDKKVCQLSYTETDEDEDGPFTATIVIKMTRK